VIGYVKVQRRYVWKNGNVSWEPIYQNVNVKVGPAYVKGSVECLYQNIINVKEEKHTYQNVNAEEPVYAELNFMPLPTQGKNGPLTNAEKHTYAKLIGVINRGGMVIRPLPPVPTEGSNNLSNSTNAEKHYDWPKVSYVWGWTIYENANYVREHIYETINNQTPKIPQSEKKVGLIKRIKNMLERFFTNLFKSKKVAPDYGLKANEHWRVAVASADYELRTNEHWRAAIAHSTMSSPDNDEAKSLKSRPNSKVKELNVARDTIVISTYC
jgi:ribosomal protein S30